MPIPFVDLRAQYGAIGAELESAVHTVLQSGNFILGETVERFEQAFATYCGTKYAVAVSSGTSALHLGLLALGAKPGDEIITVPNTFVATVAAIGYTGATARLVDVDSESLTLDPGRLEAAITPRTRGIVPVHLFGQAADMDAIQAIARKRGLWVLEDACQAHGSTFKGRAVGGLGEVGCFSFYPGKNLGAAGEGGMAITNDPRHAEMIRMLRDWGQSAKHHHLVRGYNYRLDAMQAAILEVKLRYLPEWTRRRQGNARQYSAGLTAVPVRLPTETPGNSHVWHIYAVRCAGRERLRAALADAGIASAIHYPVPVHLQPAYADLGYSAGDFPVAEQAAQQLLSLPMFAELSSQQIDQVVGAVDEFWKTEGRAES